MSLKSQRKFIIAVAILLVGVLAVCFFVHESNRQSAIRATLAWANLSPFPESAHELKISAEGNMFTRSFRISFTASGDDIEKWLVNSPGTRETVSEKTGVAIRHYSIKPSEGAAHAEVNVDDSSHTVSIYVSWS
jgi:Tfp pilus assembly protein PilV